MSRQNDVDDVCILLFRKIVTVESPESITLKLLYVSEAEYLIQFLLFWLLQ